MKDDALGRYREGEVWFPPHASTRTRLHELGHKALGHITGKKYVDEIAEEELDAEIYAWDKMDKPITHRVGMAPVSSLMGYGLDEEEALQAVVRALRRKGIKVGKVELEDLRSFSY